MKKIDLTKKEADENTLLVSKELGKQRKKIWQEQNKGLQINVGDSVKLAISDSNGEEHLWFQVKEKNPFIGRCDNTPILVEKVKRHDLIPFKFEDIEDYVKMTNKKINSEELMKLKAANLILNKIEEEKINRTERGLDEMKNSEDKINEVVEGIMNVLDDSNLTPIEILGILEMVKQIIHRECICDDCKDKGVEF